MTEIDLKKSLRKEFGGPVWALVIYFLLLNVCVASVNALDVFLYVLVRMSRGGDLDRILQEAALRAADNGWGYMIAVCVGLVLLLAWKKGDFFFRTVWQKNRAMGPGSFLALLCLFLGGQLVFQLLSVMLELIANLFGLSVQDSVAAAAMDMDSVSILLYVGILAPIGEEILFRGLILRSLEPRGRKFAIFASAFLFGIFHGNLLQSPYAFCVGLVLGYTAAEYSIVWAIVLHGINNLVIGYCIPKALEFLPETQQALVMSGIFTLCAIVGVIVLIVNRKEANAYFQEKRIHPLCLKSFFTSVPVILLTVLMAGNMLLPLLAQLLEKALGD